MQFSSAEEEAEARRFAEIAARAEAKAENRLKRENVTPSSSSIHSLNISRPVEGTGKNENGVKAAKFLSKEEREKAALERLNEKRNLDVTKRTEAKVAYERFISGKMEEEKRREARKKREEGERLRERRSKESNKKSEEADHELKAIREHYLGGVVAKRKITRASEKFARIFQFDWEDDDDTSKNDKNPLYNERQHINPLFGRGYIAGVDLREQRKESKFLDHLTAKRNEEARKYESMDDSITEEERKKREGARSRAEIAMKRRKSMDLEALEIQSFSKNLTTHWSTKSLEEMTDRDWRIFREDFDIRIQGGRAIKPLRYWNEADLPDQLQNAIVDLGYKEPSPIQRQSIPIGMLFHDMIGIAETGSGKTAAFSIPMLCYILRLPHEHVSRCNDHGPLAIIMAPTRELAQQIEVEIKKLAAHTTFTTICIVGGQDISQQGFVLRKGVQIAVGTPGRLLDCIENNYLVLNQCNYVVLDEADRMVDMGFEPQISGVLSAMGGLLKSEDENEFLKEIEKATKGEELFRITSMFSATMPPGVERIAKTFLRHPVIIKIGDEDSGKNKRITQIVLFLSEGQKMQHLVESLHKQGDGDKCIVFVNSKRQGDSLEKMLISKGFHVGTLHGGRSQEQREETLKYFRDGEYNVLVATDVAGRGLDIKDVTFVINFDMANNIENYTHRIGRTGRAGRHGTAFTYLTEGDSGIFVDLKNYLESTGSNVPNQLLYHEAVKAAK